MEEKWIPIDGFEETYIISNFGRIMNKKRNFYLCPRPNNCGYLRVQLYKPDKNKKLYIHQLVAKYFVPGYFPGAQVNHKDFDKRNNKYTNLEWVTPSQNMKHSYKHGHCTGAFKPKTICFTTTDGHKLYFLGLQNFANYLNVCKSTVSNILLKRNGRVRIKNRPNGLAKYLK